MKKMDLYGGTIQSNRRGLKGDGCHEEDAEDWGGHQGMNREGNLEITEADIQSNHTWAGHWGNAIGK